MKHIYLSILLSFIAVSMSFGQVNYELPILKEIGLGVRTNSGPISTNLRDGSSIWADDFSNPSTWVVDHDASACNLDWEIGIVGTGGGVQIDTIHSSTQYNGYAMVDSDEYGGANGGTDVEDSWITTANSIDLSSFPNVVLQFETQYYNWNSEECYVVISTNNTDWPELTPSTDISGMPNVFQVWPEIINVQTTVSNPTLKSFDISSVAGGQSSVWVRFHWTGTWGYAWFIDDVAILELPLDDVALDRAYISHNGSENQYGRIPQNQTGQNMLVGGEVTNSGLNTQTNVNLSAVFSGATPFTVSVAGASILPTDTDVLEDSYVFGPLSLGSYSGVYTVESDADNASGSCFGNNSLTREFEVTGDVYSLDGIGVYGNLNTSSLGTNSFANAEDGFRMMALYDVSEPIEVGGIEVLLAEGTVAGGTIKVSVHESVDILNDDVTNPLALSAMHTITQTEVDNGVVAVYFDTPVVLPQNEYYASCKMFSNSGANTIRVLDDQTITQLPTASVIFIPNSGNTYYNGNAAAIRLLVSFEPICLAVDAPMITGFSNTRHHGTTINWASQNPIPDGGYVVRYHEFGDSPNFSWKNISNGNMSSAYINGLNPNTQYVFRVGAKCSQNSNASYSDTASVWTNAYCAPPTGLVSTPAQTSATLSWDEVGANFYKIRYRMVGGSSWTYDNTGGLSITTETLLSATNYEWQVRSVCTDGGNRPYVDLQLFNTGSGRLAFGGDANDFSLFPNPAKDRVEIISQNGGLVEVMSSEGRVVFTFNVQGGISYTFNLDHIANGIYHIRVANENSRLIKKLVVAH